MGAVRTLVEGVGGERGGEERGEVLRVRNRRSRTGFHLASFLKVERYDGLVVAALKTSVYLI